MQQGLVKAAKAQLQARPSLKLRRYLQGEPEDDRALMREDIRQYVEVKDQYPEAIVLVQSPDQRFYEAFFDGARPLIKHLEMIGTSMKSGAK